MIGVAVQAPERDAAAEFFELFKTLWEFYRGDRHYEVLISTSPQVGYQHAQLVLVWSGETTPC